MKPVLIFDCPEKWETMKLGMVSRFCCNCNKNVHDFTVMTREEILFFLLSNRNEKVCGRIKRSQLNYHYDEILIIIESYLQKNKNSNLAFYLLTVSSLIFLNCSKEKRDEAINVKSDSVISLGENNRQLVNDLSNDKKVTVENEKLKHHSIPTPMIEEVIVGDIVVEEDLTMTDLDEVRSAKKVRSFAEIMPEFIGGVDSLKAFISVKLKYPEWERKNKIEGTVYVSFTIDEDGRVKDATIVRSVERAKDFDSEVLRVIEMMPNWKPGQDGGENVAVQFVIPIKFVL